MVDSVTAETEQGRAVQQITAVDATFDPYQFVQDMQVRGRGVGVGAGGGMGGGAGSSSDEGGARAWRGRVLAFAGAPSRASEHWP